ncbi:hypothetical protein KAZ01_02925 [Candidatus Gracilibacteria bacterium]|nr:hypothetical protein [Candidatus Gracilibacteria bacterium]
MSNRIVMNTKSLQENFPKIYQDFFSQNNLVLSGCFAFAWGHGGIGHLSKFVGTKTKVPLKCYIGFKKTKDQKIVFKDIIFYNLSKKIYETSLYSNINQEEFKIIDLLESFLKENNYKGGLEISILSETTRGHSFGFSGTSSAIISTGIHLLLGKVDLELLNNNYFDFIKSPSFKEIESLAKKLDLITKYGNTTGHASMNTLFKTSSPTLLYSEEFSSTLDFNKLDSIKSEFTPIVDKFKNSVITSDLPLDYCIIYSGIPTNTKQVESYKKADKNELNKYNYFVEKDLLGKDNINGNFYLKNFIKEGSIYNILNNTVIFISIKVIYLFKELFEKGHNIDVINKFIENINNFRHISSMVEEQNNFADDFIYFFKKNRKNSDEKIGIVSAYSGKLGGGYIVVTIPGISRDTIEKSIKDMQTYYSNTEIEYSSYLDGECSDGVIVEQYISEGIYSKYVDKNKFVFNSNKGDNYIGDYNEILEKEKDGLLFDMINSKIYFFGEKLTSKDTPSQNGTIEVITKLLENIGEEISNKEFSSSSYSKNKNEMLGKIILPLIRLVEEKTKEQLPIICKGGLTNFYVKMGNINLKIGAIKRI